MNNLNEEVGVIKFDVQRLEELFAPEFLKQDLLREKEQFLELIKYRHSSNIHVVEDYISFATDNNWCQEDLDAWNVQLRIDNPAFQNFITHLNAEGYVNFDEETMATLWVISRIMLSKDLMILGPADDFGKVAKNTFNDWMQKIQLDEAKKERRKERKLNDGERKPDERKGPKKNTRHTLVQQWVKRLQPWLRTLPGMEYEKNVLVLIGFLFHHAGFEFYYQYIRLNPSVKHERKSGKVEYVDTPFAEYLHNRIKAVSNSIN